MKKLWNLLVGAAILAILALTLTAPSHAQTLRVATGPVKGTYSTLYKELVGACGTEVPLTDVASTGSMDNIDRLVGNQVNAAFVQSDVLYLRARTEELGNVKTLLALHKEQVHIVALAQSKVTQGGVLGVGAKAVSFDTLPQLAGYRVAASGGSAITAQVIRLQSEVPFQVVQLADNAAVLKAIASGDVEAGLLVGGAPLGTVAELTSAYKLVSIPPTVQERLKGVYTPARLTYNRMGAAGVPTVATDALFVTREYKTPKMVGSLAKFRRCALGSIEELKETTGTHPAWQGVDPANRGKWPWYDLPAK